MQVTGTIKYVGVNDHDIDLFEGQYDVRENGMAYNSYVVIGEKVAVTDTVDARFVDEWLGNVETVLDGRTPDYLVVHHMEPDHSAGIVAFMDRYPDAQIVASKMAFKMMAAYFGTDFSDRQIVCKEGFELDLGDRTLRFIGAANVHWPEVMFSYDSQDKVLFPRMPLASSAQTISKIPKAGRARRVAIILELWASLARMYRLFCKRLLRLMSNASVRFMALCSLKNWRITWKRTPRGHITSPKTAA